MVQVLIISAGCLLAAPGSWLPPGCLLAAPGTNKIGTCSKFRKTGRNLVQVPPISADLGANTNKLLPIPPSSPIPLEWGVVGFQVLGTMHLVPSTGYQVQMSGTTGADAWWSNKPALGLRVPWGLVGPFWVQEDPSWSQDVWQTRRLWIQHIFFFYR